MEKNRKIRIKNTNFNFNPFYNLEKFNLENKWICLYTP